MATIASKRLNVCILNLPGKEFFNFVCEGIASFNSAFLLYLVGSIPYHPCIVDLLNSGASQCGVDIDTTGKVIIIIIENNPSHHFPPSSSSPSSDQSREARGLYIRFIHVL